MTSQGLMICISFGTCLRNTVPVAAPLLIYLNMKAIQAPDFKLLDQTVDVILCTTRLSKLIFYGVSNKIACKQDSCLIQNLHSLSYNTFRELVLRKILLLGTVIW
ncbi:hypothetical protein BDD12DRAFT_192444 [Trichophaea hybrida]|nr:hypothetical protein BDD12DRAFT_192444 [Trichophaea hybrida]